MNRFQFTDRGALEKGITDLLLVFTAGTSGAVPSTLTNEQGIASVVLDSTGVLSVHLQDTFFQLLYAEGEIQQASASNVTAWQVVRKSEDVGSATDPKVVFNLYGQDSVSGLRALANMAVDDVITIHLVLKHIAD